MMRNWYQLQLVLESINTNGIIYFYLFTIQMVVLKRAGIKWTSLLFFFPIEFKIPFYLIVVGPNIPFQDDFSPPKNSPNEATQSNFFSLYLISSYLFLYQN